MIIIKNKHAIRKMYTAAQLLVSVFDELPALLVAGVSTLDIDSWVTSMLKEKGLIAVCKGYSGYQHASCISVNDEVVHGVPSKDKILCDGDLVKVDVCAAWSGYCADMARSFFIGASAQVPVESARLVSVAQDALDWGIRQAVAGNRVSDISAAIQHEVEKNGFSVVRDFAGHGIGKKMHEEPEVLNYGRPGVGPLLRPGMALAIEPMIVMGDYPVYVAGDGWTVRTVDKSLAAHVEDTVVILEDGPCVLTRNSQRELSL